MTAGTQRRDFLYVEDAAAALVAVADSVVTGAVNVASGEGVALRDLAAQIAGQVGADARLAVGALPQRPGEPRSLVADVRRLREQVGWRPQVTLGEGIERTVDWWRTNDVARRSSSV
jgi:nucleoside-diphosphate-sugar epimerase